MTRSNVQRSAFNVQRSRLRVECRRRGAEQSPFVRKPLLPRFAALLLLAATVAGLRAADAGAGFDAANKLYEQGQFAQAARQYEALLREGAASPDVYFNLGNAWFKAGQPGRAVAAYREAERLAPRDPDVRANLRYLRQQVSGGDGPAGAWWSRFLAALTVNEWTLLAGAALWVWCALLALREARPALAKPLRGYTATAGALLLLCCGVLAAAMAQTRVRAAVVVASEAVVRVGPLEESKVAHQFRDGTELTVLDEKEVALPEGRQRWLRVRDAAGRAGWLKSDQVVTLGS
jgi:tetratricopeptide (TPR) repeat protein